MSGRCHIIRLRQLLLQIHSSVQGLVCGLCSSWLLICCVQVGSWLGGLRGSRSLPFFDLLQLLPLSDDSLGVSSSLPPLFVQSKLLLLSLLPLPCLPLLILGLLLPFLLLPSLHQLSVIIQLFLLLRLTTPFILSPFCLNSLLLCQPFSFISLPSLLCLS